MNYLTIKEAAEEWGLSVRRIQEMCSAGKIEGAVKFGREWAIPKESQKPVDARIRNGKYAKGRIKI